MRREPWRGSQGDPPAAVDSAAYEETLVRLLNSDPQIRNQARPCLQLGIDPRSHARRVEPYRIQPGACEPFANTGVVKGSLERIANLGAYFGWRAGICEQGIPSYNKYVG